MGLGGMCLQCLMRSGTCYVLARPGRVFNV
jgi:hypothetical protein